MSQIEDDLKTLLVRYKEESLSLSDQIIGLKAQKTKLDETIGSLEKMLGIRKSPHSGKKSPSNLHRKDEYVEMPLAAAITAVLSEKDGLPRIEIAKAIALPNRESIAIVSQSINNAERSAPFLNAFDYSHPEATTMRSKKLFWLKNKPQPESAPKQIFDSQDISKPTNAPTQTDIFEGLGEFLEKTEKKHYPKKAIANQEETP